MGRMISLMIDGKWAHSEKPYSTERANFVIVCDRGDWSGFMTYDSAIGYETRLAGMNRPNGYFWIEER